MKVNSVESMLRREEGEVLHAYQDHLGFWTIGVGILIDKRKGGALRPEESEFITKNRIRILTLELQKRWPWITRLAEPRQAVLIGMAFQLGIAGLAAFVNTLRNIEAGWYDKAAKGMLQSLWAKQTPERAARMAEQMKTGVWQQ
jgi:lysozyme